MRKNNINDMTVREQIEKIKGQICAEYCRFKKEADESIVPHAQENLADLFCSYCPTRKL